MKSLLISPFFFFFFWFWLWFYESDFNPYVMILMYFIPQRIMLILLCKIFVGERRVLNSELWHACAGPLVSLPAIGSRVVYFPQGHSEQVSIGRLFAIH